MNESKYLQFNLIEKKAKTKVYTVISKKHSYELGTIKWYANWRQYSFFPSNDTIFNSECLNDIKIFLMKLKQDRKEEKEQEKYYNDL